jgi:hypothetical protein
VHPSQLQVRCFCLPRSVVPLSTLRFFGLSVLIWIPITGSCLYDTRTAGRVPYPWLTAQGEQDASFAAELQVHFALLVLVSVGMVTASVYETEAVL